MRRTAPVLLVIAIALSTLAWATGEGEDARPMEIEAEFARTFNLFAGSRVRVAGVNVGRVDEVAVRPGADRVTARLRIDAGVQLPADAQAIIIQGALLGERYIQIHPPYTDGPTLQPGAMIPLERTQAPVEFEEAFESLNTMLEALDREEVARLVTNLADVLDGQGENLGRTLDAIRDLLLALRQSDEELVDLAGTLADLNTTIATRADALAQQFVDLGLVAESLASERAELDRALSALLRMADETGDLVATHRETLEIDLGTLTRVGRTTNRNLEQWERFLSGQAELFRHADRIIPFERNWLPVINHTDHGIEEKLIHRLGQRLTGLCLRLGIDDCAEPDFWLDIVAFEGDCLPPLVPCPEGAADDHDEPTTLLDILERAITEVPELGERLIDEADGRLRDLDPRGSDEERSSLRGGMR